MGAQAPDGDDASTSRNCVWCRNVFSTSTSVYKTVHIYIVSLKYIASISRNVVINGFQHTAIEQLNNASWHRGSVCVGAWVSGGWVVCCRIGWRNSSVTTKRVREKDVRSDILWGNRHCQTMMLLDGPSKNMVLPFVHY